MRTICYISGTRADYGLMRTVLRKLHNHPQITLLICVTSMHLSPLYGHTVDEIEADGFEICAKIPVDVENTLPATMAQAIGHEILGITATLERVRPDMVLLLGDRGETLAGAIVAAHLNIPIVHLHGGERSGTVDEMVRHAISKFAHYHFVATSDAQQRLIKMGESAENIYQVGAPGLDEIREHIACSREEFLEKYRFDGSRQIALLIMHPVVQDYASMASHAANVIEAALTMKLQIIWLEPNADAGSHFIREVINKYQHHGDIRIVKHLLRVEYLNCMAHVDLMLGNSSSGIIEAASVNLPVLNVGNRQNFRERSNNVTDVGTSYEEVLAGLKIIKQQDKIQYKNCYGDGQTGERCCQLIVTLPLNLEVLNKCNTY